MPATVLADVEGARKTVIIDAVESQTNRALVTRFYPRLNDVRGSVQAGFISEPGWGVALRAVRRREPSRPP
jgi:hypothetical protein